jgi:Carboxypeptidase regulatory-like domain
MALFLLFVMVAVPQTTRPAQSRSSTLSVNVTDELGAVIAKALVLLHADSLERENPKAFNRELRTSTEGKAEAVLPSGFYDVFVASTGFAPRCEKLRVRDGKPATLKIVLSVDKVMSDEYGDRFEQP